MQATAGCRNTGSPLSLMQYSSNRVLLHSSFLPSVQKLRQRRNPKGFRHIFTPVRTGICGKPASPPHDSSISGRLGNIFPSKATVIHRQAEKAPYTQPVRRQNPGKYNGKYRIVNKVPIA